MLFSGLNRCERKDIAERRKDDYFEMQVELYLQKLLFAPVDKFFFWIHFEIQWHGCRLRYAMGS